MVCKHVSVMCYESVLVCDGYCVCVHITFHYISILRGGRGRGHVEQRDKEVDRKYVWEKLDKG